ncbi:Carbamoyl-phosphate synthase arginine-specific small chain [Trichinella pseudospiralis]
MMNHNSRPGRTSSQFPQAREQAAEFDTYKDVFARCCNKRLAFLVNANTIGVSPQHLLEQPIRIGGGGTRQQLIGVRRLTRTIIYQRVNGDDKRAGGRRSKSTCGYPIKTALQLASQP